MTDKLKNIIKILVLLMLVFVVIIIAGNVYVKNRKQYYDENVPYNIRIYMNYIRDASKLELDKEYGFFRIGKYKYTIDDLKYDPAEERNKEIMLGIIYFYDGDGYNLKLELSSFEYYLINDFVRYILVRDSREENENDAYMRVGYIEYNYNNEEGIDYYKENYISRNTKGDFLTNLFVIAVTSMVYIRRVYPAIFFIYFCIGLILYLSSKKYFKGKKLSFKEKYRVIFKLAKPQRKFLGYSIIMLYIYEFIFTLKPLYWLYYLERYKQRRPTGVSGVNVVTGISVLVLELIIIWLTTYKYSKIYSVRRCISYLIPSGLIMYAQTSFFYYGHGMGKLHELMREYIVVCESFPLHPKVFYFTLFFIAGLVLYFIFGFVADKNWRKNLCWAVAFAAANSGMVCMASYVARNVYRIY